ncbi:MULTISPECIES: hypothetical protein [unclassified Corynebacterium]|uniref:hypothetical protein n=1 Tax=unclassified Corynebacterium TaxID=2624378 RepID=UPI0029C9DD20|nr:MULTISPECIES: hypothetical protein [unclassified Corynebacterium]WPF66226.1 hypothetical protein OLX12_00375 [Corynebacterium sp. 22KM0430]WPF68716.1 hypothetical protein OLW90_00375 [Corynebacterium sp. 21KM1197]
MHKIFSRSLALSGAALVLAVPAAQGLTIDPAFVPERTQMTMNIAGGPTIATANASESRPALSLSKLYLGYWVLAHGAPEDAAKVENMIRYSEDGTASALDARYPQAIPEVIAQFGLSNTHHNGFWGNTTTSTNDVTTFLEATRHDPAARPLFEGMRTAAPVAADGYAQDYGTAQLPGVLGTKFGWADDRSVHATASFGPGFSIAANTYGTRDDHTQDVKGAVIPEAPALPGVPALPEAVVPPVNESSTTVETSEMATGTEIKDHVACVDPLDVRDALISDDAAIPGGLLRALPGCA